MKEEYLVSGRPVSRETMDRLRCFEALLRRWTQRINLVAPSTLDALWSRHIEDSAQLFSLAPDAARTWVDLGSGGGLPGIVLAILAAEADGCPHVTMIEADQRKSAFLRTVLRETGVAGSVIARRIEDVTPLAADVVSARALAPLPILLRHVQRHLRPGGLAVLPKGSAWRREIADAEKIWRFTCAPHPSKTDPDAVILKIGEIAHA